MRRTYYKISLVPGYPAITSASLSRDIFRGTLGLTPPNPAKWRTLPHVQLANLDANDPKAVVRFAKEVGTVVMGETPPAEPGTLFQFPSQFPGQLPGLVQFPMWDFRRAQFHLRKCWKDRDTRWLWFSVRGGHVVPFPTTGDYVYMPLALDRHLELRPLTCWDYLRLLLTRDVTEGKAHFCANATCPAPYFIGRRNKQFCTTDCANVVMQRNFRRRHGK
jgi:hypothetical protein